MVKKILTDIHRYWFGELRAPGDIPKEQMELWFAVKPETDAHIRDTYGKYLEAAKSTEWDLANLSRMEQVGLVVLLDQFPRNIYRESGDAFAYDAKALSIARELLKGGGRQYYLIERTFVSLPFMHSEAIADQDYCVWYLANDLMNAPPEHIDRLRVNLDFATKHRDIIRKFGRFPHRNVMLGRESTPDEIEFLKGGRGF